MKKTATDPGNRDVDNAADAEESSTVRDRGEFGLPKEMLCQIRRLAGGRLEIGVTLPKHGIEGGRFGFLAAYFARLLVMAPLAQFVEHLFAHHHLFQSAQSALNVFTFTNTNLDHNQFLTCQTPTAPLPPSVAWERLMNWRQKEVSPVVHDRPCPTPCTQDPDARQGRQMKRVHT